MGTQRVQMKGVFPWFVRWALRANIKDFCPALAALGPSTKYFFFPVYYFHLFVAIDQQLCRQSCRIACLLICAILYCPEIRLIFVLPSQKRMPGSLPLKINQQQLLSFAIHNISESKQTNLCLCANEKRRIKNHRILTNCDSWTKTNKICR